MIGSGTYFIVADQPSGMGGRLPDSDLLDERVFNRETILDATVNLVPFAILLIFLALFAVYNPWHSEDAWLMTIYMWTIMLGMIVGLLQLTYAAAKRL